MSDENKTEVEDTLEQKERREFLGALVKYSAVVGSASTVILSAQEAVAWSAASPHDRGNKHRRRKRRKLRRIIRWFRTHY